MEYKNYHASVEYDEETEIFHGRLIDVMDVITFEGKSIAELKREMKCSIDEYLTFCKELEKTPDKPYSGKFNLRIDTKLHRKIAVRAAQEQKSINDLVSDVLERELS